MPGAFDWIHSGLLGQPDAYDEARKYLDQQSAANAGAVAGDPNAPFSGAYAKPPSGAPPIGAAQPGPGEPQSYQTPKSWGSILLDLSQQNQQEQQFNRSLGGMLSTVAQPRNREMVSHTFDTTPIDPLAFGKTAMDLSSQQQGQDRANQIAHMVNGPQGQQIADALHMDLGTLRAGIVTDPGMVGKIAQALGTPTPQVATLTQLPFLQQQLQKRPGATASDVSLLTPSLVAAVGPDFAQKAIGDAISYRTTHSGKDAPWVGPGGVNVQAYNQWVNDQKTVSDNQADAGSTFQGSIDKLNTLRDKLANLKADPDLERVLKLPQDSLEKNAFQEALRNQNADWKDKIPQVLLIDPGAMRVLSDLKEATGQEYSSALDSILGHGLRPTAQEIAQVRAGYGQTPNILNFSSLKDYNAQAIDPMLTRMDQASAKAHGDAGQIDNAPDYVKPFINPIYLHGGKYHLDDGTDMPAWEKKVNMPMSQNDIAKAKAAIKDNPANTWHVVDAYRRAGYNVSPLAVMPGP